jgi:hypothetical protein
MPPDAKYGGAERYSKMSSILSSLPLAMFLAENLREETDISFSYWVAVLSRGWDIKRVFDATHFLYSWIYCGGSKRCGAAFLMIHISDLRGWPQAFLLPDVFDNEQQETQKRNVIFA